MINKVVNNKVTWISLMTIIIILFIVLFSSSKKTTSEIVTEKPFYDIKFGLVGEKKVYIYEGEEYKDLGFSAILDNKTNLKDYVTVNNNIKDEVGKYEIIYTLKYKDYEKVIKREVEIKEIPSDEIVIKLKGEEKVYLEKNEEYKELGVEAFYNDKDLSEKVEQEKEMIDENHYYIKYKVGDSKEVKREIIILDIDNMFKVDKDKLQIEITVDNNISYIELPNKDIISDKIITYNIIESGLLVFKLYTPNDKQFIKEIEIKEDDIKAPIGTCEAVLYDGKTKVKVNTEDKVKKYIYNGVETESDSYKTDKYLRDSNVKLIGLNNKETKIKCDVQMKTLPVRKPSGKISYSGESETLKVYIQSKNGFYYTYLWMKDPMYQFKKYVVAGTKQKSVSKLFEDLLKSDTNMKNKIAVGINGSWYSSKRYKESSIYKYEHCPLCISNGVVLQNDYSRYLSKYPVYYINSSNQLSEIPKLTNKTVEKRKKIFQDVIDEGTYNTFSGLSQPLLVNNYVAKTTYDKNAGSEYNAYRIGLCQMDSNNFIIIASGSGRTKNTVAFANMFKKLGCKTAINIDGGGSVNLLWKPRGTNNFKKLKGTSRSRPAVMYFTELD